MIYPYLCRLCDMRFSVERAMSADAQPEPCPACNGTATGQDYSGKAVRGFVSTEGNWSGGKRIFQLHPNHPDRMVSSKGQMEKMYQKHGLCMETGKFKSKEAQIKATTPKALRTSPANRAGKVFGGLREDVT